MGERVHWTMYYFIGIFANRVAIGIVYNSSVIVELGGLQ